ncbi:MAG: hypothetical protein IKO49_02990 [Bacilli bacterium]|nr:hypothetical protein [Bacilli bacterium]
MKENKGVKVLILSLTCSGLLSTTSGIVLNNMTAKPATNKIDVKVIEKKVARIKSNVPVLKEISVEIDQPISVDVKQYISNIDNISSSVLRDFKLDTSLVNVTQAGKYTYTIEYKGKKYVGNVIVKEKESSTVILQIKNFSVKLNSVLPTDINEYLETKLTEDVLKDVKLDISKVNTKVAADYQYTITYNKMLYTGTITVYEEKPSITINTVNYTIRYRCGNNYEDIKKSETTTGKSISLKLTDLAKPSNFKECSNEIDTTKTKYTFPLKVDDEEVITIYYTLNTSDKSNVSEEISQKDENTASAENSTATDKKNEN